MTRRIRIGHSPDADDAFMFYAIAKGKVPTDGLRVEHVIEEIEGLNRRALQGELEVTALSLHAYFYCKDRYELLSCGASVGDRYGPILVARKEDPSQTLRGRRVAIPGSLTTAYLVLKLYAQGFEERMLPFDQIVEAVQTQKADFGLLIHEGQLTYSELGLKKVVDLGEWWHRTTGLPLVLGIDAVRKDLDPGLKQRIDSLLKESIQYALDHRQEALAYALEFGRGMAREKADRFVEMYVNQDTLDYGERGRAGIKELFKRAEEAGLLREKATSDK